MLFDFKKDFDENTTDIVVSHKTKGKILKFSDNYYVLLSLFNQNYHDNYNNKCIRPNGVTINNTIPRVWDLINKFKIEGIKSEWVHEPGRKDYKRYWLSRKSNEQYTEQSHAF